MDFTSTADVTKCFLRASPSGLGKARNEAQSFAHMDIEALPVQVTTII